MMSASVVICVYTERRWDQIEDAIASASEQALAAEVIVVVDHNEILLRRIRHAHPDLMVVPNMDRQGLSGARNTGTNLASAPLVAFLDDDARADPDWLDRLLEPFDSPDVEGVGGRAVPRWPASGASAILPPELFWIIGCTFAGQPTTLAPVRNVMGCAMAFRRGTLIELGGFDVDTGRVGRIPLGGEETDLCIRLRELRPNAEVLFEPRAVVRHTVSADRVGWNYLLRRSFYEGVSKAVLSRKLGEQRALETERAYVRSVLPRGVVREVRSARSGGLLRAIAIVAALAATAAGYAYGRARRMGAASEGRSAPAESIVDRAA